MSVAERLVGNSSLPDTGSLRFRRKAMSFAQLDWLDLYREAADENFLIFDVAMPDMGAWEVITRVEEDVDPSGVPLLILDACGSVTLEPIGIQPLHSHLYLDNTSSTSVSGGTWWGTGRSVGKNAYDQLISAFATSRGEHAEEGTETSFSRSVVATIDEHGREAIEILKQMLEDEVVHPETAAEALRWLGRMHDPRTYHERRRLLQDSLFSSHPWIRDGAVLGLASLDDPEAVPAIKSAIEAEKVELLRRAMAQVLEQLEASA